MHPLLKKSWSRISIRSIEPVNYLIVDSSHPSQNGRSDGSFEQDAVLDTVPYSRVFYHAHPGAIISHRGRKYKITSMARPPAFVADNFVPSRSSSLKAFAKPTTARYLTRPLSGSFITIVKAIERVQVVESLLPMTQNGGEREEIQNLDASLDCQASLAGYGIVHVKKTVHGYKKLSIITRDELSRQELSLPDLEYESLGIWLDADKASLGDSLGDQFGPGVHALSHALLAVAPLFVPGLVRSDIDCDHSWFNPTQVIIFDERAGGSGSTERLWKSFFREQGIVDAAIALMEQCSSCSAEVNYNGGCPACLHAPNCLKFNNYLSRRSAIVIGKRLSERLRKSDHFQAITTAPVSESNCIGTPRRLKRKRALEQAKGDSRDHGFVVGRASWPLDEA